MKRVVLPLLLVAAVGFGLYQFGIQPIYESEKQANQTVDKEKTGNTSFQIEVKKEDPKIEEILATKRQTEILLRENKSEPSTIDPHYVELDFEQNVVKDMFEGLVVTGKDGTAAPGLCTHWDISEDGLIYTFYLRDNLKWSNGEPITTEDIIYGFQRAIKPENAVNFIQILFPIKNARKIYAGEIKDLDQLGVRAINDKTIIIELEKPKPYFEQDLNQTITYTVPKKVIEKYGKDWTKPENMITNGPYKLVQWKLRQYIEVEKNDHYHAAEGVSIKRVKFFPIEDSEAGLRQYRAGDVDLITNLPLSKVNWAMENYPDEIYFVPKYVNYYYTFNMTKKPFDDVRVRKALSMSVDRKIIANRILKHGFYPLYSFTSPGMHDYTRQEVDFKETPIDKRIVEAKRLLAEAGYGPDNPLKIELAYNTYEIHALVASAMAGMWEQNLGIKVRMVNTEATVHYNNLKDQNFEISRAAFGISFGDPFQYLNLLRSKNVFNYGKYINPEFDDLVLQAESMANLKKRREILERAERIIMDDHAVIPLLNYSSIYLVRSHIQGFHPNYADDFPSRFLRFEF